MRCKPKPGFGQLLSSLLPFLSLGASRRLSLGRAEKTFLYNDLYVMGHIHKAPYKTQFSHTLWMTLGALTLGYVVLLILLALVTPNSKLGSILHLKK